MFLRSIVISLPMCIFLFNRVFSDLYCNRSSLYSFVTLRINALIVFLSLTWKTITLIGEEPQRKRCGDSATSNAGSQCVSKNMDLSNSHVGAHLEKVDSLREAKLLFSCDYSDPELVHKISQILLPGLASACIDNTTGGLFGSPALVADDLRKELVDYLVQRSETFVAEFIVEEGDENAAILDDPVEIISSIMDDYASSKRNILGRFSSWLLSDKREEKIDDFVQEMEVNDFWPFERRETVAVILVKNVDYKNTYHCSMKFERAEELQQHKSECKFRMLSCMNEGCRVTSCAFQAVKHDSTCPFKVLPCEQSCTENIMRREMDKHCLTVCPMKPVNCPFYQFGCQVTFPRCSIGEHCSEFLLSHVSMVLRMMHKEESDEDHKNHVELIEKFPSYDQLSDAHDVRSLMWGIKDIERELEKHGVESMDKRTS